MKFTATSRSVQGSSASRRLRRAGRVPAIVYGGKSAPVNIELDHNEIFHALNKDEFHATILDMDLEGKTEPVLLRAVQWHPYRPQVLHVDFQRVQAAEAVTTRVPVRYLNAETSPAVKLAAQIVTHGPAELGVTCLPADLPPFIEVDLAELPAGGRVHLSDITLPAGVQFVPQGEDTNPLLAQANPPRGSTTEDDGDEGDAPEEPAAE